MNSNSNTKTTTQTNTNNASDLQEKIVDRLMEKARQANEQDASAWQEILNCTLESNDFESLKSLYMFLDSVSFTHSGNPWCQARDILAEELLV